MLRMRLRRTGAKKQPRYRIVIMESQSKRDGAFVDWLGFYDPLTNPPTVRVNEERTRHWLSKGVSMSDTVRGLLRRTGFEEAAAAPAAETATDVSATESAESAPALPDAEESAPDQPDAEETEAPVSRRARSRKQE